MVQSKIPAEAWELAEVVYPEGSTEAAVALLAKLGYEIRPNAVQKHMNIRGISTNKRGIGEDWSEEEIAALRKYGPKLPTTTLIRSYLPNRTVDAVSRKAILEGVSIGSQSHMRAGGHDAMVQIPPEEDDIEVRLVVLGDQQIPEIDYELHRAILEFLIDYLGEFDGPKYLVNLGDLFNATTLGKFDYPIGTPDIQEEINEAKRVLQDYSNAAGGAIHYFIEGNHEWRLQKAIRTKPDLGVMIAPMSELLGIQNIGVEQVLPYIGGTIEFAGNLLIEHGYRASKHSGYTAKLNVEDTGMNHIVGHTHRLGVHYKRLWEKTVVGIENGCLCHDQSYAHRANWQRGFTVFRFWGKKMWFQQVYANEGDFYFEGKHYGHHT